MLIKAHSTELIGRLARAERKRQGLRQDDFAAMIGSSHVFLRAVEQGKPGVQLGKVLQALEELGITVYLDVAEESAKVITGHKA